MNIDAILEKIAADAQSDAEKTLRLARQKADALHKAFDEAAEQKRKTTVTDAQAEAKALRDRMLRMAGLEERKRVLEMKRAEIDHAFEAALDKLLAMPKAMAGDFLLRILVSNAQGNERLIVSEQDAELYDGAFLARVNAALSAAGKPSSLSLSEERRPLRGGFVLSQNGMEVNCSYDSLLRAARDQMEGEVAAILFPA